MLALSFKSFEFFNVIQISIQLLLLCCNFTFLSSFLIMRLYFNFNFFFILLVDSIISFVSWMTVIGLLAILQPELAFWLCQNILYYSLWSMFILILMIIFVIINFITVVIAVIAVIAFIFTLLCNHK